MTEPRTTRAERLAMPLARDSIRKIAEAVGGCLRPVQLRRTDTLTGQVEQNSGVHDRWSLCGGVKSG